jgi:hypothetical protein
MNGPAEFWGMKALRPRRVFIACPVDGCKGVFPSVKIKRAPCWHNTLEELTLRLEVYPQDRDLLHKECLPDSIKTVGGRLLELADAESKVSSTWEGFDKKGERVVWHSLTYVWKSQS